MAPRLRLRSLGEALSSTYVCTRCSYAKVPAASAASVAAPSQDPMSSSMPQLSRHHPLQPPSYRDPTYHRSQKLRSYVSLLQSTPLMLFFQHNNLKAGEWAAIRRELARAVSKVDNALPSSVPLADNIKLQVISTTMFEPALRITEYYDASQPPPPALDSSSTVSFARPQDDPTLTHSLSTRAYKAASAHKYKHPLTPILRGSLAVLIFPSVSPQHLSAALSVLAPHKPGFPAPTRRTVPSYYDAPVQDGLRKLLLLAARIEGRVFDQDGVRWVGSIEGGIDGLRAQLVQLLQMPSVGLTGALDGLGRNLWMTLEGRRRDMEEKQAGGGGAGGAGGATTEAAAAHAATAEK